MTNAAQQKVHVEPWYGLRCGCGRFAGYGSDCLTAWGSSFDYEPPDPEVVCKRCAEQGFNRYLAEFIQHGLPKWDHRPFWQAPEFYRRARAVYRGMRKHGLLPERVAA